MHGILVSLSESELLKFISDSHVMCCVTGMQSSLLGLALANRFFPDPMVGLPSALSVSLYPVSERKIAILFVIVSTAVALYIGRFVAPIIVDVVTELHFYPLATKLPHTVKEI